MSRTTLAWWMVAAPLVCATCLVAAVAAGERGGWAAFTAPPFLNSAEAAAAGDAATMLWMIRLGDNPTRVYPVRPHLISPAILRATTVEAAMWSRQISLIRVLDREGAIIGDDDRRGLACLAVDLELPEVAEYLAPGLGCAPGHALARLAARSRPE